MERGAPRIERCDLGRWRRDHVRRAARARASNPEAARRQGRTRGRRGRGPVAECLAVRRTGACDPGPRCGDRAHAAITGRARGPLGAGEDTPTPCDHRRRNRRRRRGLARAARGRAGSIADRGDRHELGHDRHAQARLAVAVAGAPLPPEIAQRWEKSTGIPISSFYGSMDAGQLAVASPSDPQNLRWTTVGRPHDRAEWKIVDGEICMRGDLVQDRYWGEDAGPYAEDGWAHMGDLGFVDESGFLHVVGRVKDIIIRGGTNINPYEVESMLRMHPAVLDACVVGRPDAELGEVPVAFIVGDADKDELDRFLEDRGLAHYKWPAAVYRVGELPLSGPGKVNRNALREDARAM